MTLIAELGTAQLVFMGAVLLITYLLLSKTHRYWKQNWRPLPTAESFGRREADSSPSAGPTSPPVDMAQWEVQMHELTRELSARLDSKMGALGQLIREADRAAARLETALARAQGAVTLPSAPAKTTETAREVLRVADGLDGSRANQADGLKPRRESSSSLASSLEPARGAAADGLSSHHRYDEIYILADYGHSPAEIAQRLGIPIGEVELILSLRSKR